MKPHFKLMLSGEMVLMGYRYIPVETGLFFYYDCGFAMEAIH